MFKRRLPDIGAETAVRTQVCSVFNDDGRSVGRHIRLDCPIKPIKHLGVPTSDELDLNGRERLD